MFNTQQELNPATPQQLDPDQFRALELFEAGENLFITGGAGTGKSTLIKLIKENVWDDTMFLAPTGTAALNIEGSTIHSGLGLPPQFFGPDFSAGLLQHQHEKLRKVKTVVIDEISMVRADLFAAIDSVLRQCAGFPGSHEPFGGKQIVVVGDFFQLPPVITSAQEYQFLYHFHHGTYAFQTPAWQDADFKNIILKTVHRQSGDQAYLQMLNAIRHGNQSCDGAELETAIKSFNQRVAIGRPTRENTILCTKNERVDQINEIRDAELGSLPVTFIGKIRGYFPPRDYPTHLSLDLRIGSRVMTIGNERRLSGDFDFVNGNTGYVADYKLDTDRPAVDVLLDSGKEVRAGVQKWENRSYELIQNPHTGEEDVEEKIKGTFEQVMVRPAYAITIHKSQGKTLNRAHVELGRGTFASGQLYTALSRCRELKNLTIDRPLRIDDIIVDTAIAEFYADLNEETPTSGSENTVVSAF